MLGRDLEDADEWVRSWSASVSARAEAAAQLADRVASISTTATGADGAIRVTVAGSGVVTGLELDDRVHKLPGAELAEEILRAMRRAQSMLTGKVATAVDETVGSDTETGRAVIGSFELRYPTDEDDVDRERKGGAA
jgi:DNA-binding protein YbaB